MPEGLLADRVVVVKLTVLVLLLRQQCSYGQQHQEGATCSGQNVVINHNYGGLEDNSIPLAVASGAVVGPQGQPGKRGPQGVAGVKGEKGNTVIYL